MPDDLFSEYDGEPSPAVTAPTDPPFFEPPGLDGPPSAPPPLPPPRRARPTARAALVGGLSGALLAAIAAVGLAPLTDHDSAPKAAVVTASATATTQFEVHS